MKTLSARLDVAMKAAGLNQPQLARAASRPRHPVSQQVVQHLLSGRNESSKHLFAIAEALNVNSAWRATGRGLQSKPGPQTSPQQASRQSPQATPLREALLVGKVGAG